MKNKRLIISMAVIFIISSIMSMIIAPILNFFMSGGLSAYSEFNLIYIVVYIFPTILNLFLIKGWKNKGVKVIPMIIAMISGFLVGYYYLCEIGITIWMAI